MSTPKNFNADDYEDPKLAYYAVAMLMDLSIRDQRTAVHQARAERRAAADAE